VLNPLESPVELAVAQPRHELLELGSVDAALFEHLAQELSQVGIDLLWVQMQQQYEQIIR